MFKKMIIGMSCVTLLLIAISVLSAKPVTVNDVVVNPVYSKTIPVYIVWDVAEDGVSHPAVIHFSKTQAEKYLAEFNIKNPKPVPCYMTMDTVKRGELK